ncbi:hypothetical protein B7P43_G07721 [Cryptotermes secundus]|uniref:AN1-type domain-containing protein n=1 Tax=Cryptotermes secundus TaxID=105785 RepID=A0A2J7Q4H9_9NEOP|nr:hypothetical protein B7P43_G07721 [Cryptotermes secundus]
MVKESSNGKNAGIPYLSRGVCGYAAGDGERDSKAESSVNSRVDGSKFDGKSSDCQRKKMKKRCALCRKKLALTAFECRCGGLFCEVHRYTDRHICTFDYRNTGAQEICLNNPVVVARRGLELADTLRVVGGDEKGIGKSETVKYGRQSQGTRTREDCAGKGRQHIQKTGPASRQRAPHKNKIVTVKQ